jgi:hypothetical protein
VSGKTLSAFATTRVPGAAFQYVPIVAGELVLSSNDRIATAQLLANGRLGAARAIPDDLLARGKEAVPTLKTVQVQNGLRVGARTVWALRGAPECHSIGSCPNLFVTCCSADGAATDLTRFVDRSVGAGSPQLGLDGRGKLWLAWLDRRDYSRAERGVPRILELDPSTLAPRTKAVAAPGLVADKVVLACATSCRIVAQSATGDILSWAPGERSSTLMVRKVVRNVGYKQEFPRELLGATYSSGRLAVAYRGQTGKERPLEEIGVARGDARGARARVVGAVETTFGWPAGKLYPPFVDPVAYGTFAPGGLVAFEYFRQGNAASPVVYAFVPFGR